MLAQSDIILLISAAALYAVLTLLYTVLKQLSEKQGNNLLNEYGETKSTQKKGSILPYLVILVVVIILYLLVYKFM